MYICIHRQERWLRSTGAMNWLVGLGLLCITYTCTPRTPGHSSVGAASASEHGELVYNYTPNAAQLIILGCGDAVIRHPER